MCLLFRGHQGDQCGQRGGRQTRQGLLGKGRSTVSSTHLSVLCTYQISSARLRAYTGQSSGNLNQNLPQKKKRQSLAKDEARTLRFLRSESGAVWVRGREGSRALQIRCLGNLIKVLFTKRRVECREGKKGQCSVQGDSTGDITTPRHEGAWEGAIPGTSENSCMERPLRLSVELVCSDPHERVEVIQANPHSLLSFWCFPRADFNWKPESKGPR